MYRNDIFFGGVRDAQFNNSIIEETYGEGRIEDVPAMAQRYPPFNEYWAEKVADVEKVDVPTYVVGSWTNPVHSRGTSWAWERLRTEHRWLRVHNTMEWPDYYSDEAVYDLRRFFDRYLKGIENDWESTPRVRLSVLDPGGKDSINKAYSEFPLPTTQYRPLYLDGAKGGLSSDLPSQESSVRYSSDDGASIVHFTHTFEEDTEVIGHVSLRLWVEVDGHNDADLHVWLRKFDAKGGPLTHFVLPFPELVQKGIKSVAKLKPVQARMPGGALYGGPWGKQKVALRALDPERSTPGQPFHKNDRVRTGRARSDRSGRHLVVADEYAFPQGRAVPSPDRRLQHARGLPARNSRGTEREPRNTHSSYWGAVRFAPPAPVLPIGRSRRGYW
ncbi:CocE/NonD family hydrolase C-terminal non-catalytic domain-containing protein [Gordonia westfalica]|uniref:CocE/NonD family hydrolase C-terminal non-catalytic domain-containing protein n=1 Tax=Gordonia westfalica TaxID=158898 RepID=A0ABU2GZD0_9ACTN|nr:CocE/NonD family hydrolase C-terminal non-catalytic domain-containing protein [Gordonia westfalica]MDS1116823.1 CocE/NonD family hydrolase C-terminal non-catalytic domain-containing protein [Gordonia westfalica]